MLSRKRLREIWMAAFADEVARINPALCGRIHWDTAVFLFNRGDAARAAAAHFCATFEPAPPPFPPHNVRVRR